MCTYHPDRPIPRGDAPQDGLTFVELVMAIVILAIAVTPLLSAFTGQAIAAVRAERSTIAHYLAAEKAEQIIADRHCSSRGYSYLSAANYPEETSITGFDGFTRSVTFTEVSPTDLDAPSPDSGSLKITVTVTETALDETSTVTCVVCEE